MPTVLIIAGGNISRKLPYLNAACSCPALIPVNTRPLASYVLEVYGPEYDLHLFVDEAFIDDVRHDLPARGRKFTVHGVTRGPGVVDTLRQAVSIADLGGEVVVNLVTTVSTRIPRAGEVQVGDPPVHSDDEWAALSAGANGPCFHMKGSPKPDGAAAFTGVFCLEAEALREAVAAAARQDDLLSVVEAAAPRAALTLDRVDWIDCGHETNYYKSRALLINSRSFNRMKVDPKRGTILKSSSDKQKLALETGYIEGLPPSLRILFPRLVSSVKDGPRIESYEMEYYGYPNLAEYLLYWNLSKDSWWRCFDALNDVLNLFREHPASIGPGCYRSFHWDKTLKRIDAYLDSLGDADAARNLLHGSNRLNGEALPPLDGLLETAGNHIGNAYREDCFAIYHGDFCFNNILFDVSSGIVRLIDPRGSFGELYPGIHGDRRYDLAKLSHSATGQYDFIVNGLFRVAARGQHDFQLDIERRPNEPWLHEMNRWIVAEQAADPREIAVMTAVLFLSMCPLHADDPERQLAFFLHGHRSLHQALQ